MKPEAANQKAPRQTMLNSQPPPAERPKAAGKARQAARHPTRKTRQSRLEGTVLIAAVDSDDASVCAYLVESEGLKVVRARTREEALRIAPEENPALIVIDLALPEGGGDGLAAELRLLPTLAQVPILRIGAYTDTRTEMPADTFAGFIQKPVRRAAFTRKVRDLVGWALTKRVEQQREQSLDLESPSVPNHPTPAIPASPAET